MSVGHRTARGTRGYGAGAALGIVATAAAGVGIVGLSGSQTASAEPVSLTLHYTCAFSGLGSQPVTMELDADLPNTIKVGKATPKSALNGVTTVDASFTQWATLVGAKTVEGSLDGNATVTAPQGSIPLTVPMTIPRTAIPASGSFDVTAKGTAPSLTFSRPGKAKVTVGDLTLHLTPKDANGNTTAVGTINASCALDAGQNTVLQSIVVTEPVKPTATTSGEASSGTTGGSNGRTTGGTGSGGAGGSTKGTRPGAGSGRSTSGTSGTSTTPSAPAHSSTGSAPRPPTASQGAPTVDTAQDDATSAADDNTSDDLDPRNPIVLTTGVLVVGGVAATVGFGSRLRKRRSSEHRGPSPGR
ncbi:DUF6801 domain-containing protein [Streptomyces sp. NPDC086549]|uniref:DUF6801 domain-containing protein n=1 Tax=Streptomyces sp. NPDC086549 TaxID=3365752 RepID=UPI00380817DC